MKNATDKYAVDLHCAGEASSFLPWPIKILRVHDLYVYGCKCTDYLEEHDINVINIIPDSLRVLRLSDTDISIKIHWIIVDDERAEETKNEKSCEIRRIKKTQKNPKLCCIRHSLSLV
ncbi:hypothetical protein CHS0354_042878 [Potamilus streckersoni]|uniref:Uncharacterized protein n=1 Tax=Potamilus streckersoni TaxID=2493646 RepID=A0AAE0W892_9BIVA|nr:hypothetical protein CHS0354_042878 [Potamilus streckersoni]